MTSAASSPTPSPSTIHSSACGAASASAPPSSAARRRFRARMRRRGRPALGRRLGRECSDGDGRGLGRRLGARAGADTAFPSDGSPASTARIAAWSSAGSAATVPVSLSAAIHRRNDRSAVAIIASTSAVTGRSSSSSRLWIRSTSKAISPSSVRPTIRPLPFSVWNCRRTVRRASRSPGLASSSPRLPAIASSTSAASAR